MIPPALEGFRRTGAFEHSENWESVDGTPVQITDDPLLAAAIGRAEIVEIDGLPLRVLTRLDLLRAKLRAAADPALRRSKRLLDLADAQGLVEERAGLAGSLDAGEREILEHLRPWSASPRIRAGSSSRDWAEEPRCSRTAPC